jgi:hypothetical protein
MPAWPGLTRTARTIALRLLVVVVLVAPFPASTWLSRDPPLASRAVAAGDAPTAAGESAVGAARTQIDDSDLLAWLSASDSDVSSLVAPGPDTSVLIAPISRAPVSPGAVSEGAARQQAGADDRLSTLERLLATPRPHRDPMALASRLAGSTIPWTATEPFVGPLQAGRRDTFYVLDQTDNQYKSRSAVLRLVSQYAYWYVQEGETVADADLATAAKHFDEQTVPTVHRVFGSEWSPGIDGDARVTIFLGSAPGVGAYFSSWDEYPRSVYRFSNEREMIHINLGATRPGAGGFDGTLAHEFQHMVHWHLNPQDDTWLDEGFAELASALSTASRGSSPSSFGRQPDVQLTAWSQGPQNGLHYQASYLFSRYFAQRFGQEALGQLLSEGARPPESITTYLSQTGRGITFDDLFEDWIVANLLDDPSVGDGRYAHDDLEHRAMVNLGLRPDGRPAEQSVQQYGAEYVELQGGGADAELVFEGTPTVRLVGADPTSGRSMWWSNRADGLDSSLTRGFDLRGVATATLRFNLWYDTERDFDFFYVLASTDGGTRWQVLRGASANDANPTGNAIGPGYSGQSGLSGGQRGDPAWLNETVDLTPFAGSEVLIRFEYVTDQGYNARGVLLDDVELPEIGFRDDAEADAGWTLDGFLRSDNVIPQTWSLQLVERQRGGQTRVRPLRANGAGQATERLPSLGGDLERAVLVISGLAPRTLEPAPYRVTLRPAP